MTEGITNKCIFIKKQIKKQKYIKLKLKTEEKKKKNIVLIILKRRRYKTSDINKVIPERNEKNKKREEINKTNFEKYFFFLI